MIRRASGILVPLVLLLATPAMAIDDARICVYVARPTPKNPNPELRAHGRCATERDGTLAIAAGHLAALDFDDGLAALLVGNTWYYALPDGRTAAVISLDNGADVFSQGLARTTVSGRVGFIDRTLRIAIGARFDFAWPFHRGIALVCMGCQNAAPDAAGHTSVVGGRWGYIDKSGEPVVPIEFTREAVLAERPRLASPTAPP